MERCLEVLQLLLAYFALNSRWQPQLHQLLRTQEEEEEEVVSNLSFEQFPMKLHQVLSLLVAVAAPVPEAIDPYELFEAVDMLSKMPKDFYERIVSLPIQDGWV